MTTATEKTDRASEAIGRLIDQFKGRANVEALVRALVNQSQAVEGAAFDVVTETLLATAEGEQLDGLGQIVGVERGGRSDSDYRVRIGAKILQNNASGTIAELVQLAVVLGATTVELTEIAPAEVLVVSDDAIVNGSEIGTVLGQAKAAGVKLSFVWHESTNPFRFGVAGQGFDEGELAESIGA